MQGGYTTFSAGSINQQIAYLQAQIDAIDLEITSLTTQVNANTSNIATIQGQITTIQGQITALQISVAANTANIATNTANITTIQGQISTIQGQITTLQSSVATNTANIATLQTLTPLFVHVPVSSAQILTSNTSRVQLIASPSAGKAIVPISVYVVSTFGTTPYATNTSCRIQIGGLANGNLYNFAALTLLGQSANAYYVAVPVTPIGGTPNQAQAAQAMFFATNTGNPTGGNGTLDFYIYYYIVTL